MQPLGQSFVRADQGQVVGFGEVAALHAILDVAGDGPGIKKHEGHPGLIDVFAHAQPRLEEAPVVIRRVVELGPPQDVAVQQHSLTRQPPIRPNQPLADSGLAPSAGSAHDGQGQVAERVRVSALRADGDRAAGVNDLVGPIVAAVLADVDHGAVGSLL